MAKDSGVEVENYIKRQGSTFKEGENKNNIYEIVDNLIKEGYPIFDIDKYINNKEKYSKLLSKLTDFEEKRIREDKDERFKKELKKALNKVKEILVKEGYIDEKGELKEKGLKLYSKEIIGNIEKEIYGIFEYGKYQSNLIGNDEEFYKKYFGIGDKYSKIDPKETIRKYLKYGEIRFVVEEKKENKGGRYVVLLDISGSMIGDKIFEAKKALIILTEKILEDHNLLDIILFNDKILKEYRNVKSFEDIIDILKIVPNGSTDISMVLEYILNNIEEKSHIILITDALPTHGEKPVYRTLETAKKLGSTCYISIIGIQLNKEGEEIAKQIVKYGNGRLFIVKNLEELKKLVLLEYELSKQ
ncbi:hypothetical protein YN1_2950 [Nanoarchaeota archaeon]